MGAMEGAMTTEMAAPVPPALEAVTGRIISACITVHRELGPGLLEVFYQRAVAYELSAAGVPHQAELVVPVRYKGTVLGHHRLDLVVADSVIVEVKAIDRLAPIHLAQVISYLRLTRLRVALLINFNVPVLKEGVKRVVL